MYIRGGGGGQPNSAPPPARTLWMKSPSLQRQTPLRRRIPPMWTEWHTGVKKNFSQLPLRAVITKINCVLIQEVRCLNFLQAPWGWMVVIIHIVPCGSVHLIDLLDQVTRVATLDLSLSSSPLENPQWQRDWWYGERFPSCRRGCQGLIQCAERYELSR